MNVTESINLANRAFAPGGQAQPVQAGLEAMRANDQRREADAPRVRFWRGWAIGFAAGFVLVQAITAERRPQERVHTIVEPEAYALALLV